MRSIYLQAGSPVGVPHVRVLGVKASLFFCNWFAVVDSFGFYIGLGLLLAALFLLLCTLAVAA